MTRTARKEKEVDYIRNEILHAAARAAGRTGLDALTIKDIAKETGYTVGTLYNYFDGKDAIVQALVRQLCAVVTSAFRTPMPKGLTFRQKVELLTQRHFSLAEEWRDGISALIAIIWGGAAVPVGLHIPTDVHDSMVSWIVTNAGSRDIGKKDPLEVAMFLLGVMVSVLTTTLKQQSQAPFVSLVPRVMELTFNGLGRTP